tara:strand:+ start:31103 stop:31276 length:174 start_codon:yes stop_codon:yes gene_type:complete
VRSHHSGKDRLDLVCCEYTVGEKCVQEGAMHVGVAFVWGDGADEGRDLAGHGEIVFR